jgi:hypothetical protein
VDAWPLRLEYKGKGKDLAVGQQLLQYRENLENPPLLVVCDLQTFEVHTNFTGTTQRVYRFTLADLASPTPIPTSALPPLDVLRALLTDPAAARADHCRSHRGGGAGVCGTGGQSAGGGRGAGCRRARSPSCYEKDFATAMGCQPDTLLLTAALCYNCSKRWAVAGWFAPHNPCMARKKGIRWAGSGFGSAG